MIRALKILTVAAMALVAVGVVGASGAQAANFHCHKGGVGVNCDITVEKDGTSKTAHHVFMITNKQGESTSVTCNEMRGSGSLAFGTGETVTLGTFIQVSYFACIWNGSAAEVNTNLCNYELNANGNVSIVGCGINEIEIKIPTCTAKIGAQAGLEKVTYNNIGTSPTRTVTVAAAVKNVKVTSMTGVNCGIKIGKESEPFTGEYTTGNTILKAESTDGLQTHLDGWWQ